jgi:hypothetical protein
LAHLRHHPTPTCAALLLEAHMKTRGTALYPFVPSGPDFARSLVFFDKRWENDGLADLRFGDAYFMLQDISVPEWQKNQMITYEVDDLDSYWSEIEQLRLEDRYSAVKLKPPTDYPWGREIYIIDPGCAGICANRTPNKTRTYLLEF